MGKATLEELQEITRDLAKSQQKITRDLAKSQQEARVSHQETEAALRDFVKETEATLNNFAKETKASQQEVAEVRKETEAALIKLGKNIDKVNGNLTNKWGRFVEHLVEGDLVNLLSLWKIKVNRVYPQLRSLTPKGNPRVEFDLVAMNGKEVVVVEVKSTLNKVKIDKFVDNLKKFKEFFPEYKDKTIYGGVAYLEIVKGALGKAEENGLFVIKAPGGECKISTITNKEGFKPAEF